MIMAVYAPSRAGTGSNLTGSGRARASDFGLGSGSGLPKIGSKPVGLKKIQIMPFDYVKS